MITIEQIQKRIIESIKESGLTQTEIASKLNISRSAISHYVKADILPALDTLENLCKLLDLDANDILSLDSENN